jgi:hypothetical protein
MGGNWRTRSFTSLANRLGTIINYSEALQLFQIKSALRYTKPCTTCIMQRLTLNVNTVVSCSDGHEIPWFYGTRKLITIFTKAHDRILWWDSSVASFQIIQPKCMCFKISNSCPTCITHLISIFITLILGDEFKLWSSSLCNFLHSLVTSSFSNF